MKSKTPLFSVLLITSLLVLSTPTFAYWVWSPESGKFVNPNAAVQDTPQQQYDYAMEFYKKKDLKKATEQLRLLLKKYPSAQIAAEAQYRLALIYEELGQYQKAFRAYRDLLQKYPQSERLSEAIEREFRIGNLFLSGKKGKLLGLEILPSLPKAIEVFKHIVEAAPYSEYGEKAQYHLGLAYKKSNQFEEAILAFQTLIDQYPQSDLISQARYEIADTSYLESVAATRDQRVIDRAADEIDRFLQHYPNSSVSDQAAKLRQEIDEKNAEKNYRIALYYEKENFLDSAFIYYRDVSKRYPHTQWGKKAMDRLQALEKPAEYLKAQAAEANVKKDKIREELQSVGKSNEAKRKELEGELKRAEKDEKAIEKSKKETLKRRRAALRQKEKELQEKWKILRKKKKRFSKNPSDDLTQAFQRWETSIEKEKADLVREKLQINEWDKSLGVNTAPLLPGLMLFGKEAPSALEQIQQFEAKRFKELMRKRTGLLQEKEKLYLEYEKSLASEGITVLDPALQAKREELGKEAQEIQDLENQFEEKNALYKKNFGTASWQAAWQVPKNVVERSVGVLNPFEGNGRKEWGSKSAEELKVMEAEWQGKIKTQKALVDTIAQAFDQELARAEEKRLQAKVEEKGEDPNALRRSVKQLEREIRSRYNEIQDRNERKNELLEELDQTIRGKKEGQNALIRTGRVVTAPARGAYAFGRAFLFGIPEKDVQLTNEAEKMSKQGTDSGEIRSLREEIELESLMIEARNEQIESLARQVDALRAQASLSEAPKFRSLLVRFPYVFIREAIVSAENLIPKEKRHEKLIEQLNRESEKLEQLKRDLSEIQALLLKKGESVTAISAPVTTETRETPLMEKETAPPDRAQLEEELRTLKKQLELKRGNYESEKKHFDEERWNQLAEARGKAKTKELTAIEKDLMRLIEDEKKIRDEEKGLLVKKKEAVEHFLSEPPADLFSKELNLEREEIESRLKEIQNQQTSLGEEQKRLKPQGIPLS